MKRSIRQSMVLCGICMVALAALAHNAVIAEPSGDSSRRSEPAAKDKSTSDSAERSPLDRLIGYWSLVETHYTARGEVSATVKGTEEVSWALDKRAVRRSYVSGSGESAFRAVGMLTWNAAAKRFEGSWFDSHSTSGPQVVSGEWDESNRTMIYSLSTVADGAAKPKFNIVERFIDDDHRTATTYSLAGGKVEKVLEVAYARTIPCPAETAGLRTIIEPNIQPPKKD